MFASLKRKLDDRIGVDSEKGLWNTSILLIFCGLTYLGLTLIDSRQVLGVNTWIKPSKFAFSIASYTINLAYILPKLDISKLKIKLLSRITWVFMWIEFALISMQAARGVQSHFNTDTGFDITVYALMGVSIVLALIPAFFTTYYLFTRSKVKNILYSLSLKWGMVLLILGSAYGGKISAGDGHSVGAEDGTPGISYLGWSKEFGDVRVAHFLAIHGIHVFLTIALFLNKQAKINNALVLKIVIFMYYLFTLGVLVLNEVGKSVFAYI